MKQKMENRGEQIKSSLCICLLCGIPGSGKSTISKLLQSHNANSLKNEPLYLHIEYDRFIKFEGAEKYSEDKLDCLIEDEPKPIGDQELSELGLQLEKAQIDELSDKWTAAHVCNPFC